VPADRGRLPGGAEYRLSWTVHPGHDDRPSTVWVSIEGELLTEADWRELGDLLGRGPRSDWVAAERARRSVLEQAKIADRLSLDDDDEIVATGAPGVYTVRTMGAAMWARLDGETVVVDVDRPVGSAVFRVAPGETATRPIVYAGTDWSPSPSHADR
jgi:hypothetical protein